jgi:hypothetical protein
MQDQVEPYFAALASLAAFIGSFIGTSKRLNTKKDVSNNLETFEFIITPKTRKIDTNIDVKMGEFITGEIDLSNPFHIDTSKDFLWMSEFIDRYTNQGKWIGSIKYVSPSGMKTFDEDGKLVSFDYPDSVFKTWGAVYLQVSDIKYRLESLSMKDSLINSPPDTKMKPLLIEKPGRIFIYVNPHPYIEGTEGEIIVRITKNVYII